MTAGPDEVTSWMELLVWLSIIGVPSITTIVGLVIQSRRSAEKHSKLADDVQVVRDQVVNSHTTNLRDDIDAIKAHLVELDRQTVRISNEVRADREQSSRIESDLYDHVRRAQHLITKLFPGEKL